ncbi:MAG: lipocalin-like domain-containing protein [Gemmatimonadota bacterium]|nr:lipocalin-like domain-containing protein [Gemmatimonadota bacterium]MDH3421552.1 lipocalin-like domain-containing protein [Gemmatimonadota bacterium]
MVLGYAKLRLAAVSAVALLVFAAAATPGRAQAARDAPVAMQRFVGAWDLVDWRTTSSTGEVAFPYGENAKGRITYSVEGGMSAHLMRPPADPADAPRQYLGYWGTFSLDTAARTVTHHVVGSDQANWIGSDQVRGFRFEGSDRLVLSLGSNQLTWVRIGSSAQR